MIRNQHTVQDAARNAQPARSSVQEIRPQMQKADAVSQAMAQVKELTAQMAGAIGHVPTFHVTTFGCQMNAHDSEKLRGMLLQMGYEEADSEQADYVIFNTCSIRENANLKVYGRLGRLGGYKKKNPHMLIGMCGCMMQEQEVREKIAKSYPYVDVVFGTNNIHEMPSLTLRALKEHTRAYAWYEDDDNSRVVEALPHSRTYAFKSGVNITYGCNNFCTYCIVPYVRGREYSRHPDDILEEVKHLADDGVKEIMLLGQNVNSYGNSFRRDGKSPSAMAASDAAASVGVSGGDPYTFPGLLSACAKVDGIERIRFMTSHPKDLSDELIAVMAQEKKVCRHLHLPVQSGSSRILKRMNRRYTRESYLMLVEKLRAAMPDLALTTDVIVGFPGESEEDFEETYSLFETVRYDNAFTFLYSPRPGTPAASFADQIPEKTAKRRFNRLLKLVQETAKEKTDALQGETLPVLIEQADRQDARMVSGRLENNTVVHLPGDESLIGSIIPVYLKESRGFYYIGERG